MMVTHEKMALRVNRALNIFLKRGGSGNYTKPYSDFAKDIQTAISRTANMESDEAPIIASYRDQKSWVLLTSKRLVWSEDGVSDSLPWEKIKNATIPVSALAALGSSAKKENAVLEVVTDAGKIEVVIEPGSAFSGFWNVLKSASSLS